MRKLEIHYDECAAAPGYIEAEWSDCDCTAAADLENLLAAARAEIQNMAASGALQMAVDKFDPPAQVRAGEAKE